MVKVTKNDILYYFEHYKELPSGINIKKIKKAEKKIKKRKENESNEKLKKSQLSSFVRKLRTIVCELKRKELSGDQLNNEIDILFKPRTPSPYSSPESLGSLKGLDDDELEMELIKRNREVIAENYYKAHPDEVRVNLRSVSPIRKSEGSSSNKKTIKKKKSKTKSKTKSKNTNTGKGKSKSRKRLAKTKKKKKKNKK